MKNTIVLVVHRSMRGNMSFIMKNGLGIQYLLHLW